MQVPEVVKDLLVLVHPHLCNANVVAVEVVANVHLLQLRVHAEAVKLAVDVPDVGARQLWRRLGHEAPHRAADARTAGGGRADRSTILVHRCVRGCGCDLGR